MNEAADFRIEVAGEQARCVLHSTVPLPRVGIDFQSATFFLMATRWFQRTLPDLKVMLTYEEPADLSVHRAVYGGATLCFGAAWNGFIFDAAHLDTVLPTADPSLHQVLRDHAERLLAQLAPSDSLVERVRQHLLDSLQGGPLSANAVAERLGLSRRTLARRLLQRDTSFTALLEQVRHKAAAHYLEFSDHSLDDIAFLLGFSESSAFVRAFKRWQGVTPMAYRSRLPASSSKSDP
jgi:AraC-like DNA-binding protein